MQSWFSAKLPGWLWSVVLLAGLAAVFATLGAAGNWQVRTANSLMFAAWCAAMLLLFVVALRLPLRVAGPRYRAMLLSSLLAGAAVIITGVANLAVYRHDSLFDVSRAGTNTPPPQLQSVIAELKNEVSVNYFYNAGDENALKAKELLTVAARQNPHLHFYAVDLDQEPARARALGVRAYNTAIVQTDGRRVVVENTVDLAQVAYGMLRALKTKAELLCLVTGHGENVPEGPPHFHYGHVETLKGHEVPGAGDVLQGEPGGLDRLQLAVSSIGYDVRAIVLAKMTAIPGECSVLADIGPRRAYPPGETQLLADYLAHGGRLLLMVDPTFPVEAEFAEFLSKLGIATAAATVIDPLNHYGPDADKVAVAYYPAHPITSRLAMTIFPDSRPLRLLEPPAGIKASVLASSSNDSYLRPAGAAAERAQSAAATQPQRSPEILAVALEGRWPAASAGVERPFRAVIVGNSNFAANAYFPYVSNGEFALGMVRWLAGDDARPAAPPQSFSLEEVVLTRRQMRDIFVMVELALPMSVVLFGTVVWWRRR